VSNPGGRLTVLLFGATGSAGGSVLRVCCDAPEVREVRAVVRTPPALVHPKLLVITHNDFENFADLATVFSDVDACFYCLGKSVRQVSGESEYRRVTYSFALAAAAMLRAASPGAVFHFVSGNGAGTASRFMWARVKGETEHALAFFGAVSWRPAMIDGVPSVSEPVLYKMLRPVGRILLSPFRNRYVTGGDLGRAMLVATADGVRGTTFSNAEIRDLAKRYGMTRPAEQTE
jgi:uncharacterized protein YbjT (DUF2867 family)